MWSLSEWRRQRILAKHPVAPEAWHEVRQHLSILDGLDDEQDNGCESTACCSCRQTPDALPGVELHRGTAGCCWPRRRNCRC
jgi:MtfA peptidase